MKQALICVLAVTTLVGLSVCAQPTNGLPPKDNKAQPSAEGRKQAKEPSSTPSSSAPEKNGPQPSVQVNTDEIVARLLVDLRPRFDAVEQKISEEVKASQSSAETREAGLQKRLEGLETKLAERQQPTQKGLPTLDKLFLLGLFAILTLMMGAGIVWCLVGKLRAMATKLKNYLTSIYTKIGTCLQMLEQRLPRKASVTQTYQATSSALGLADIKKLLSDLNVKLDNLSNKWDPAVLPQLTDAESRLSETVEAISRQSNNLTNAGESVNNAVGQVNSAQAALAQLIENVKGTLQGDLIEVLPQIKQFLDDDCVRLRREQAAKENEIIDLQNAIENEQHTVEALNQELQQRQNKIQDLETQNAGLSTENQNQTAQIASLTDDNSKLQSWGQSLNGQIAVKNQECDGLRTQLDSIGRWNEGLLPNWIRAVPFKDLVDRLCSDFRVETPSPFCLLLRGVLMEFHAMETAGELRNLEDLIVRLGRAFYGYFEGHGYEGGTADAWMRKVAEAVNALQELTVKHISVKIPRVGEPITTSMKCTTHAVTVSRVLNWGVKSQSVIFALAEVE